MDGPIYVGIYAIIPERRDLTEKALGRATERGRRAFVLDAPADMNRDDLVAALEARGFRDVRSVL